MSPLHFGDEIEVSARFTSFEPLIRVAYTVQNLTENQKSARGYTVLALTDTDRNRISGIPESLIAHLKPSA
jgi:acyl-CoA thioesterase FadM